MLQKSAIWTEMVKNSSKIVKIKKNPKHDQTIKLWHKFKMNILFENLDLTEPGVKLNELIISYE